MQRGGPNPRRRSAVGRSAHPRQPGWRQIRTTRPARRSVIDPHQVGRRATAADRGPLGDSARSCAAPGPGTLPQLVAPGSPGHVDSADPGCILSVCGGTTGHVLVRAAHPANPPSRAAPAARSSPTVCKGLPAGPDTAPPAGRRRHARRPPRRRRPSGRRNTSPAPPPVPPGMPNHPRLHPAPPPRNSSGRSRPQRDTGAPAAAAAGPVLAADRPRRYAAPRKGVLVFFRLEMVTGHGASVDARRLYFDPRLRHRARLADRRRTTASRSRAAGPLHYRSHL